MEISHVLYKLSPVGLSMSNAFKVSKKSTFKVLKDNTIVYDLWHISLQILHWNYYYNYPFWRNLKFADHCSSRDPKVWQAQQVHQELLVRKVQQETQV